jgi:DNA-binding transcriptional LysR family regulator
MRINFELLDLRIFLTIFDYGSFGRAAELLNFSQPALSRRILMLEQNLEVQLFDRSTRRVTPTAAALRLEPLARRILADLDSSIMSVVGGGEREQGYIVIASIPSAALYFLPKVVKQFNKRYPLMRVRIIDRTPQDGLNCVVHGEVEFGINMLGSTGKDIVFTHLIDDPYVFVCHPKHPLAAKRSVTWRHLRDYPLVSIGQSTTSENRALLDRSLTKTNVQLNWFYEVSNVATALGLVEADLAAAILPRLAAPQNARPGAFVAKLIEEPKITRDVGIVERRRSFLSVGARYFRDMLLSDWRNYDISADPITPSR